MAKYSDLKTVITILIEHYLNVGSNGYDKDVYQDEYLQGLGDGVELVNGALKLYQHDRQKFNELYLKHRYNQPDVQLSTKPVKMYVATAKYRPDVNPNNYLDPILLVVHVPKLKFCHCYLLITAKDLNDFDHKVNPKAPLDITYHQAVLQSFSELFNSKLNQNTANVNFQDPNFLKQQIQPYQNNLYRFDEPNIKTKTTSQATLDLDINKLLNHIKVTKHLDSKK